MSAAAAAATGDAPQPLGLRLRPALAPLVQADDDVDAGVAQVEGMGMPLAAVADDGHGLAGEAAKIGILS